MKWFNKYRKYNKINKQTNNEKEIRRIQLRIDMIVLYTEILKLYIVEHHNIIRWETFWELTDTATTVVRYTANISRRRWLPNRLGKIGKGTVEETNKKLTTNQNVVYYVFNNWTKHAYIVQTMDNR